MRIMRKYDYSSDESLSNGTVIYWTRRIRHRNNSGGIYYKVPILCPSCGNIHVMQQGMMTFNRRNGTFTGLCRHCNSYHTRPMTVSGPAHPLWRGGSKNHKGYIYRRIPPDHPYVTMAGPSQRNRPYGYVQVVEHRLRMAEHLGRPLEPYEHVHHIDGNKSNNDITNLELATLSTHNQIESLLREVERLKDENERLIDKINNLEVISEK